MNNSSLNNAQNRFLWLDKIINNEISPSPDLLGFLKDMRTFCTLEVYGYFRKISYNTLQNAVMDSNISISTDITARDRWSLIKKRRLLALTVVEQAFPSLAMPEKKISDQEHKNHLKECLWHATLCSQAFLELHNDLKNYLEACETTIPDLERLRLKRIFDKSRIMYFKIIDPEAMGESKKLKVIEGGKNA